MAGAFGQALAALAWSFLKWYLERQSIRDDERRKVAIEALERINLALDWKSAHNIVIPNDPFGDFVSDTKPDNSKTGNNNSR